MRCPGRYSRASLTRAGSWEPVIRVQVSQFDGDVVQIDLRVSQQ
jgi:hypothetical protein